MMKGRRGGRGERERGRRRRSGYLVYRYARASARCSKSQLDSLSSGDLQRCLDHSRDLTKQSRPLRVLLPT